MEEKSLEEMMSDLMSDETLNQINTVSIDNTVKEEVQQVVKANQEAEREASRGINDFEADYVNMMRKADKLQKEIQSIKLANPEIFNKIAELELEIDKVMEPERKLRNEITAYLETLPSDRRKYKGLEFSVSYVNGSKKNKFNEAKLKEAEPIVWAKYVEEITTAASCRIKVDLLPELNKED